MRGVVSTNPFEKPKKESLDSDIEERFKEILQENDCFEDLSQPELDTMFWMFRQGVEYRADEKVNQIEDNS